MYKLIAITALLLGLYLPALQAQQKPLQLYWSIAQESTDTLWFFSVIDQHDDCINRLVSSLKAPAEHQKLGMYTWRHVAIPGVGDTANIELRDGMMEHDRSNARACWIPFDTDKNKAALLKQSGVDHKRLTEIKIIDAAGNNMLNSPEKGAAAEAYIWSLLQQSK